MLKKSRAAPMKKSKMMMQPDMAMKDSAMDMPVFDGI